MSWILSTSGYFDGYLLKSVFRMDINIVSGADLVRGTMKLSLDLKTDKNDNTAIMSPGSAFKVCKLPVVKDSLIQSVMFSLWDNVLGPKIVRVWTNDDISTPLSKDLLHISSHTLNGEICRDPDDPSIDTKFYSMKDRGFLVISFVFTARRGQGLSVHSVSVLVPAEKQRTFLPYYTVTTDYLHRCLACLRVQLSLGQEKYEDSLEEFSLKIQNLIELFNSLSLAGVPTTIRLSDTYFLMRPPEGRDVFLRRAVTSHLMTCGHTVVLGRTSREINPLISTLCLLSSTADRACSRYVRDDQGWGYEPQLAVQGIVVRDNRSHPVTVSDILSGPYPSTIIDLTKGEILSSPPCHEHVYSRHEMLKTELACVLEHSEPITGIYPTSNIFQPVNSLQESLVSTLCTELSSMPVELKVSHIDQFMRSLDRRAMLLIKYVEASSSRGKNYMKVSVDKLRRHLDLKLEGDFRIVLAAAERLKEGIYGFVLGDPKLEREQFLLHTI